MGWHAATQAIAQGKGQIARVERKGEPCRKAPSLAHGRGRGHRRRGGSGKIGGTSLVDEYPESGFDEILLKESTA